MTDPTKGSQCDAILAYLREHPGGMTPLDALREVGSFRLGARIWDLREAGYDIVTDMVTLSSGKRVARYRLVEAPVVLSLPW